MWSFNCIQQLCSILLTQQSAGLQAVGCILQLAALSMHAQAMSARQITVTDQLERSMVVGFGSHKELELLCISVTVGSWAAWQITVVGASAICTLMHHQAETESDCLLNNKLQLLYACSVVTAAWCQCKAPGAVWTYAVTLLSDTCGHPAGWTYAVTTVGHVRTVYTNVPCIYRMHVCCQYGTRFCNG